LRDEPGTTQFEVLVPNDDPNKLHLFELYTDTTAFIAHMKGPSMAKVTQEVGHLVVSLTGIQSKLGAEVVQSAA
jgi:quinol monooxygenase YgiN